MVCFLLLNQSDVRCITAYYYTMKEVTLPHFCNHPMSRSQIRNKVISTTTTDGGRKMMWKMEEVPVFVVKKMAIVDQTRAQISAPHF